MPSAPHSIESVTVIAQGQSLAGTFRSSLRLLGTRRFGTFWIASLLSSIGTWAQQVAEPWLLLTMSGSPFLVGLDAFLCDASACLLMPFGGALADRVDRRRLVLGFQSVQMLCPVLIVVLLLTGVLQPWTILVLSVVVGVTDALSIPSYQSIVPSLVEPERIGTGIALNATQFSLSRILGPAVAGVLIASVGAVGCFAVSAASYVPFILVAMWILPRRGIAAAADAVGSAGLAVGFRAIVRLPDAAGALVRVFVTGLCCGPLVTFCPVLVRDVLHGGADQFAWAVGALGVGGLIGATSLLAIEGRFDRRQLGAGMATGLGAVVVVAASNDSYPLLLAMLVLAGAMMTIANTSANTLLQVVAGEHRRGHTASLFLVAMRGGLSLGSLVASATVTWFGVAHALQATGALAVIVQLLLWRPWAPRDAAAATVHG